MALSSIVEAENETVDEAVQAAFRLASYVPHQVLRHYVANPTPLQLPHRDVMCGAVLFADISGFTPLTERLCKQKGGAALLTGVINAVFEPLIAVITDYGGDIIKFAGDALIVLFHVMPKREERRRSSVLRRIAGSMMGTEDEDDKDTVRDGDIRTPSHRGVASPSVDLAAPEPAHSSAEAEERVLAEATLAATECGIALIDFLASMSATASSPERSTLRSAGSKPFPRTPGRSRGSSTRSTASLRDAAAALTARPTRSRWGRIRTAMRFARRAGEPRRVRASVEAVCARSSMSLMDRYLEALSGTRLMGSATLGSTSSLAEDEAEADVNGARELLQRHPLRLKVGIGAGTVEAMHVGGVRDRWEYLIAGDGVAQMADAEGQCEPGDVVLAPPAWELLKKHELQGCVEGTELRGDAADSPISGPILGARVTAITTPVLVVPPSERRVQSAVGRPSNTFRVAGLSKSGRRKQAAEWFDRGCPANEFLDRIRKDKWRNLHALAQNPDLAELFRGYMPQAAQRVVDDMRSDMANELRRASTLFIMLPDANDPGGATSGSDEGEPGSQADGLTLNTSRVQDAVSLCLLVVAKYRGTVRQFLVDDKGAVLIVAWGVPPFAHSDDERRAAEAALDIERDLTAVGMQASIGVTTDRVYLGNVGSACRREYALVGDAVNLSARLMAHCRKTRVKALKAKAEKGGAAESKGEEAVAAAGTMQRPVDTGTPNVLCDKHTYDATSADVKYNVLEPIMVKGKTDPIPVFEPQLRAGLRLADSWRRDTSAGAQPLLVGRDQEMTQLIREVDFLCVAVGGDSLAGGMPEGAAGPTSPSKASLRDSPIVSEKATLKALKLGSDAESSPRQFTPRRGFGRRSVSPRKSDGTTTTARTDVTAPQSELAEAAGTLLLEPVSAQGSDSQGDDAAHAGDDAADAEPVIPQVDSKTPDERGEATGDAVDAGGAGDTPARPLSRVAGSYVVAFGAANARDWFFGNAVAKAAAAPPSLGPLSQPTSRRHPILTPLTTPGSASGRVTELVSPRVADLMEMRNADIDQQSMGRPQFNTVVETNVGATLERTASHLARMVRLATRSSMHQGMSSSKLVPGAGEYGSRRGSSFGSARSAFADTNNDFSALLGTPVGGRAKMKNKGSMKRLHVGQRATLLLAAEMSRAREFQDSFKWMSSRVIDHKLDASATLDDTSDMSLLPGGILDSGGTEAKSPMPRRFPPLPGAIGTESGRLSPQKLASRLSTDADETKSSPVHASGRGMAPSVSKLGSMYDMKQFVRAPQRHSVIIVDGMRGMGRHALLFALKAYAQQKANLVTASATADDLRTRPYAVWAQLLPKLVDLTIDDSVGFQERAARRLQQIATTARISTAARQMLPLLNDVLPGLRLPETPVTRSMPATARSANIVQVVLWLLSAVTRQAAQEGCVRAGLALFVKNAHKMDSASMRVFALLRGSPYLLLCMSMSSGSPESSTFMRMLDDDASSSPGGTLRISLAPLSRVAISQIVANEAGVEAVSPEIVDAVHVRSLGVPLFATHLVKTLVADGIVEVAGAVLRVARGATIKASSLPASMEGFMTAALDKLSGDDQFVLRLCAVSRTVITPGMVCELRRRVDESLAATGATVGAVPMSEVGAQAALGRLDDAGFLRQISTERALRESHGRAIVRLSLRAGRVKADGSGSGRTLGTTSLSNGSELTATSMFGGGPAPACYNFSSISAQELVYNGIPYEAQQRIHAAMASWIDSACESAGDEEATEALQHELLPERSFHWSRTTNVEKATVLLEAAAQMSLQHYVVPVAIQLASQLVAKERAPVFARIELPDRRQAYWHTRLAELHADAGNVVAAREHATAALSVLGRPLPSSVMLKGRTVGRVFLAECCRSGRRLREMAAAVHYAIAHDAEPRVLARGETAGDDDDLAASIAEDASQCYGIVARVANARGDSRLYTYCLHKSLSRARCSRRAVPLAEALAEAVLAAHAMQLPQTTVAYYVGWVSELLGHVQDVTHKLRLTGMLSRIRLAQAEWEDAATLLVSGARLAQETGNLEEWEGFARQLGSVSLVEGQAHEALVLNLVSAESAKERQDPTGYAQSFMGAATAHIAMQQTSEAQSALLEIVEVGDTVLPSMMIRLQALQARVSAGLGDVEAARRMSGEAAQHISVAGMRPVQWSSAEAYILLLDVLVWLEGLPTIAEGTDFSAAPVLRQTYSNAGTPVARGVSPPASRKLSSPGGGIESPGTGRNKLSADSRPAKQARVILHALRFMARSHSCLAPVILLYETLLAHGRRKGAEPSASTVKALVTVRDQCVRMGMRGYSAQAARTLGVLRGKLPLKQRESTPADSVSVLPLLPSRRSSAGERAEKIGVHSRSGALSKLSETDETNLSRTAVLS